MNYIRKINENIQIMEDSFKKYNIKPGLELASEDYLYSKYVLRLKLQTWIDNGEKIFILSNSLIEAFKNTDIPWGLCPNNFHYPFNAFIIEAQDSLFETKFIDHPTEKVRSILFLDKKSFINSNVVDPKKFKWDKSITGIFTTSDGNLSELMMNMGENETIEESSKIQNLDEISISINNQDIKNMANIFFNTVLYINDPSRVTSDTETHKTRSVKNEKSGKFHDQKYILLRPPRSYISLGSSGRKIDKRFIVRGHWWPKLSNTESQKPRRWILPYWKGPELSEVLSKPYKLGGD